ncbi:DUF4158 domain-containing protein [Nonomuraea dietziae]|uniref:DUF4158 domain-containing protein n=1 Tax=Nonomuraea dietziae TaxID=65515 RepID=UPI0033C79D31
MPNARAPAVRHGFTGQRGTAAVRPADTARRTNSATGRWDWQRLGQPGCSLAFAILLKFYTQYGRFPRGRSELPDQVVEHVAKQVQVPASELGFYEWSGSTIEYRGKGGDISTNRREELEMTV